MVKEWWILQIFQPTLALIVASVAAGMALWYFTRPKDVTVHLVYKESAFMRHILSRCPLLRKSVDIPRVASNTHLQTMLPSVIPRKHFKFDRKILRLKDGGHLALDWGEPPCKQLDMKAPVLLILPGLTGGPAGFKFLCNRAVERGFRCVVFNKRGHGGTSLSTPKLQSFGDPSDLREVVMHIRGSYPQADIVAAGYSAGSGLLVSYLGEYGHSSDLTAGLCNCPAYHAEPLFNGGLSRVYEWLLVFFLKKLVGKHKDILSKVIDMDFAFASSRLRDFEDRVYRKLYDYDDMSQYWEKNCPMRQILNVRVPVLCLNAFDDPVCRKSNIPMDMFQSYDNFLLAGTERGGHCGFLHGSRLEPWADKVALEYFSAVLSYEHKEGLWDNRG